MGEMMLSGMPPRCSVCTDTQPSCSLCHSALYAMLLCICFVGAGTSPASSRFPSPPDGARRMSWDRFHRTVLLCFKRTARERGRGGWLALLSTSWPNACHLCWLPLNLPLILPFRVLLRIPLGFPLSTVEVTVESRTRRDTGRA